MWGVFGSTSFVRKQTGSQTASRWYCIAIYCTSLYFEDFHVFLMTHFYQTLLHVLVYLSGVVHTSPSSKASSTSCTLCYKWLVSLSKSFIDVGWLNGLDWFAKCRQQWCVLLYLLPFFKFCYHTLSSNFLNSHRFISTTQQFTTMDCSIILMSHVTLALFHTLWDLGKLVQVL